MTDETQVGRIVELNPEPCLKLMAAEAEMRSLRAELDRLKGLVRLLLEYEGTLVATWKGEKYSLDGLHDTWTKMDRVRAELRKAVSDD